MSGVFHFWLLFESQSFNEFSVCLCVFALQIFEETAALSDLLEKSTAGAEIFAVSFEVAGKLLYLFRKNCDLHLRRSGVGFMGAELLDDLCFFVFVEHRFFYKSHHLSSGMLKPQTKMKDI